MKFKGKHFKQDRQAQYTVLRKGKNYEDFEPEELPKIANDANQTDLQKKQNSNRKTKENQNRY